MRQPGDVAPLTSLGQARQRAYGTLRAAEWAAPFIESAGPKPRAFVRYRLRLAVDNAQRLATILNPCLALLNEKLDGLLCRVTSRHERR